MERTTLTTADGVHLAAVIRRTQSPTASVVVAHGFGASADALGVGALARALVDAGYDVITYDARGHGQSEGFCTLGDLERHDVDAAQRALTPEGPVVLVGVSMGAIAVLRHAASATRAAADVAGVVTLSAPARWQLPRTVRGIVSAAVTATPPGRAFAARRLGVRVAKPRPRPEPPIDLVARVCVPVAIVHAGNDPFLPVSNAHALYAAANEPRRLELVAGRWHAIDDAAVPAVVDAVEWSRRPITRR